MGDLGADQGVYEDGSYGAFDWVGVGGGMGDGTVACCEEEGGEENQEVEWGEGVIGIRILEQ